MQLREGDGATEVTLGAVADFVAGLVGVADGAVLDVAALPRADVEATAGVDRVALPDACPPDPDEHPVMTSAATAPALTARATCRGAGTGRP